MRNLGGFDFGQQLADARALRFQPRREFEARTQFGCRFVEKEAGRVGGDLEEDAGGRAEVDGLEILPILDGRNIVALAAQGGEVFSLLVFICGAEGDVVDGTCAKTAVKLIRSFS